MIRQAAEDIVKMLRTGFAPYTIVRVDEKAFSHLDLARYRQFQEAMEGVGYRFLSDLEIVEINKSPTTVLVPTMIRSMVSADGETSASYYQCRHKIQWVILNLIVGILTLRFLWAPTAFLYSLRTMHCYDFTSELGGAYVGTSTAKDAAAFSLPSSIDTKFFGYGTSLTEVRTTHEARLAAAVRRAGTSARPTKMSSHDDVRAMQARLKRVKDAHRAASGWITEKEILTMAGGDAAFARAIYKEVQKILAERPISTAA
jgi:hypothetical protein